ncbi:CDGSH iron-sulfur domain-containing protein [Gammaproteobacteria bacterium]|nr:CDGSH iron-sulfur domain-containing protein [Gammaproteobacteria bacterium]
MSDQNGHLKEEVTLQCGEKKAICRCLKSKNMPFCDGSHREAGEGVMPVIIYCKDCK